MIQPTDCTVYLVRHGLTDPNRRREYLGCDRDPGILPESRDLLLSRVAEGRVPDDIRTLWVSPLRRTRETADLYFPDGEPELVPEIRERGFGEWEGKTWKTLRYEPEFCRFIDQKGKITPPEGESYEAFSGRIERAMDRLADLARKAPERFPAALVCHGGVVLYLTEKRLPADHPCHRFYLHGGGILKLTFRLPDFVCLDAVPLFDDESSLEATPFYKDYEW